MSHPQLIRQATIACLQGQTAAGDQVYPTPILPWRRELPLPAIGVYTLDEPGESLGDAGPFTIRYSLRLVMDLVTETPAASNLEPAARLMIDAASPLDALIDDVKGALLSNFAWYRWLGPPPQPALFEMIERLDTVPALARVEESDRRTVAAQMTAILRYTCIYEPVIPDDFIWMDLNVDVIDPAADPNLRYPGPDGRIEVRAAIPKQNAPAVEPPPPFPPPPPPVRSGWVRNRRVH